VKTRHFELTRRQRKISAPATDSVLRAGAARVDITPSVNAPTSGYSKLLSKRGEYTFGRLFAQLLVVDDGHGERVLLGVLDLHTASSPIVELVAEGLADEGIDVARVFITATHTHCATGNLNGSIFYDHNLGADAGFDFPGCKWIARRIIDAVQTLIDSGLQKATVSHGIGSAVGHLFQRSLPAFRQNASERGDEPVGDRTERAIDDLHDRLGVPPGMRGDRGAHAAISRAVDPRLQSLVFRDLEGRLIGVFATAAVHGTSVSGRTSTLSADWMSLAALTVERNLTTADGMPVIAFGSGAQADANACLPEHLTASDVSSAVKRAMGADDYALCRALARNWSGVLKTSIDDATEALTTPKLRVGFSEHSPVHAPVDPRFLNCRATVPPQRKLDDKPRNGRPALGGSELAELGKLLEAVTANEGLKKEDTGGPQGVKAKAIFTNTAQLLPGRVPKRLPFRSIRISSGGDDKVVLVGASGEITAGLSGWLAKDVRSAVNGETEVMVSALCGEYSGYWTTGPEYDAQHYEGASTLWGAASCGFVRQSVAGALASGGTPELIERRWRYSRRKKHRVRSHHVDEDVTMHFPDRAPEAIEVHRDRGTRRLLEIIVRFRTDRADDDLPVLGAHPLVQIEVLDDNGWEPATDLKGVPLNDRNFPSTVHARIDESGDGTIDLDGGHWTIRWHLDLHRLDGLNDWRLAIRLGDQLHAFAKSDLDWR